MALPPVSNGARSRLSNFNPGGSTVRVMSAATTNPTLLGGGGATLMGVHLGNNGAGIAYLKIYDKATAPVPGTDIPVVTHPIPAGGRLDLDNFAFPDGVSNGLGYAITGAAADSDTTAIVLNQVCGFLRVGGLFAVSQTGDDSDTNPVVSG